MDTPSLLTAFCHIPRDEYKFKTIIDTENVIWLYIERTGQAPEIRKLGSSLQSGNGKLH